MVFFSIADAFVRMYFMDMACKIQVRPCPDPSPNLWVVHSPPPSPPTPSQQLYAQAAGGGGGAGLRLIGGDVMKDMEGVRGEGGC